jgi:23S rRNA pseudouridine1911/1915/1917 synthase
MDLHREHVLTEPETQERLDVVLARVWGESRAQLQRWFRDGRVTSGEVVLAPRSRVEPGCRVELEMPEPEPDEVQAEAIPLDILYEDEAMVVVNKAAGMVVHPGSGCRSGTLVAALLHHCRGSLSGIGGVERPGIVHRLDKETSGVMVAAKHDAAHRKLAGDFAARRVSKTYLAYVLGRPKKDQGEWTGAIGRHPVARQKMTVRDRGGRAAHTRFRVLHSKAGVSLLELDLLTGRTHQIRVHAAHAGCPLLGDGTYGRKGALDAGGPVERQLLHAWRLVLNHPQSGEKLEFTAPVPEDFKIFESWLKQQQD